MAVYFIAQVTVHDPERYEQYRAGFHEVFATHDGRVLAADDATEVLEGEWACTRTILLEFPSEEAALAWYRSEEYQEVVQLRFASCDANAVLVHGR